MPSKKETIEVGTTVTLHVGPRRMDQFREIMPRYGAKSEAHLLERLLDDAIQREIHPPGAPLPQPEMVGGALIIYPEDRDRLWKIFKDGFASGKSLVNAIEYWFGVRVKTEGEYQFEPFLLVFSDDEMKKAQEYAEGWSMSAREVLAGHIHMVVSNEGGFYQSPIRYLPPEPPTPVAVEEAMESLEGVEAAPEKLLEEEAPTES